MHTLWPVAMFSLCKILSHRETLGCKAAWKNVAPCQRRVNEARRGQSCVQGRAQDNRGCWWLIIFNNLTLPSNELTEDLFFLTVVTQVAVKSLHRTLPLFAGSLLYTAVLFLPGTRPDTWWDSSSIAEAQILPFQKFHYFLASEFGRFVWNRSHSAFSGNVYEAHENIVESQGHQSQHSNIYRVINTVTPNRYCYFTIPDSQGLKITKQC